MLDIKYIVEHADKVKHNCTRRKVNPTLVDEVVGFYQTLKATRQERDGIAHKQRLLGEELAIRKTDELLQKASAYRETKVILEKSIKSLEESVGTIIRHIPNMTHPAVGDDINVVATSWPDHYRDEADRPKTDHVALAEKLGIVDFESASSIAGSKFYYLKNKGVLLESALIRYAFDVLLKKGFSLYHTPDLALANVVEEMGFVPRGESSQVYQVADSDLCLIGTAEITLGSLHRDQAIRKDRLPLRYGGISHCFRKEAGSLGKDTKGLYRVHQFTKVEMFVFCLPEDSEKMLEELLQIEIDIYDRLKLPYRVVDIPAYDLGNPATRKFDIEVFMPGRNDWGEVTSASNCTDYQSRRLKTKYQGTELTDRALVHTLNGTAIAIPRTIIAILENYQRHDGKVAIPEVLRPYTGFDIID